MVVTMELKDIILETISSLESTQSLQESSEIQEVGKSKENAPLDSTCQSFETFNNRDSSQPLVSFTPKCALNRQSGVSKAPSEFAPSVLSVINEPKRKEALNDEVQFLSLLQERLLVLFEGFNGQDLQSNKQFEMVLNFLQYQLSVIERRLEILSQTN